MSLKEEYKSSLKSIDVEEILDLLIFRPLSFLFVKLIYPTNLTPNQISIIAMFLGILSGVFYSFGTYEFIIFAAASFFMCNLLDCADGQLARLKKNGTRVGRIIDGLIDYVTAVATFVGIGIALGSNPEFGPKYWIVVAAGGISRAFQNMYFDYFRNLYLRYVYHKVDDVKREIEAYEKLRHDFGKTKGRYAVKSLIDIYVGYSKWQMKITKHVELDITPEEYKSKNKLILRAWSWLGSTTHLSALVLFSVLNRLDLYFWAVLIPGNLLLIILFIWQKRIINNIKNKSN
jgi:hypothetical protein